MKTLPYESANAGDRALTELQRTLEKFGCASFGVMTDAENGKTIVQFKWRERQVSLEASWKGYAGAWLKIHPYKSSFHKSRADHESRALAQAKMSVCSCLRGKEPGMATDPQRGRAGFAERRSVGQLYSRANS